MAVSHTEATVEVPPHGGAEHHKASIVLKPDTTLVIWTWITFAIVLAILYKVAWKPILAALDARERNIHDSIEKAEAINRKLEEIKASQDALIAEADQKAKTIIDRARHAAAEAAQVIDRKAREESQILLQNAEREIQAAQAKAAASLKKDSARIAVALAEKILSERLSEEKQQALTDRLIREL